VMQYDINHSGHVTVAIRDVVGISGTGTIIIARFKTAESAEGLASLKLTSISATDVTTLLPRPVEGDDGWINTGTLEVLAPVLRFPEP
jgi:hypothetical protein